MKTYDFLSRERYASVAYSSPAVDVFSYFSEGVLCGSFDKDNYTESFDKGAWDEL
jgi:hypothetical protein